ncbi:hypothetical protein ACFPYI_00230 [Halomarina salina]|uniref:Uncharacterized protein n=1 Tax=Halomarina salina TaxID=1872699 RepID=A0ABD5RHH7_9EURY|nr:hypothetical protein [Halomarina salina]
MVDPDGSVVLTDHPRLVGVVFTILLALSRAGVAASNTGSTVTGP